MNRRTYAGILFAFACVAGSCVPNKQYRTSTSVFHEQLRTPQFEPTQNDITDWPYTLSFIEFDDHGEMFDRQQLTRAVQAIADAKAKALQDTHAAQQRAAANRSSPCHDDPAACLVRAVVIVFIHGWKNNASEGSGNVWGFRQVLAGLSLQYSKAPVVGVYIGWRGAVVSAPILKELTFFDRHRKSQNLPNAHMVEALLNVMQAAKGRRYDEQSTISVLIGHSFGGAVLESALTQPLMSMILERNESEPPRWPATLIVFLNEAQEAIRSYQLIESMHVNLPERPPCAAPGSRQTVTVPAVLSITSTGDYATGAMFPTAQTLERPFNSLRTYDRENFLGLKRQTPMFLNTAAHMGQFQSHVLGARDDPEVTAAATKCEPAISTRIGGTEYLLVEKPGAKNRTPYWVMHMPPSIVPDHSTIFTPVFRKLLTTMIYQVTIP